MLLRKSWTKADLAAVVTGFTQLHASSDFKLTISFQAPLLVMAQDVALPKAYHLDLVKLKNAQNFLYRHRALLDEAKDLYLKGKLELLMHPVLPEVPKKISEPFVVMDRSVPATLDATVQTKIDSSIVNSHNAFLGKLHLILNAHLAGVDAKLKAATVAIDHKISLHMASVAASVKESELRLIGFWNGESSSENSLETIIAPLVRPKPPKVVIVGLKGHQMQVIRDLYQTQVDLVFIEVDDANVRSKLTHATLVIGVVKFMAHSLEATIVSAVEKSKYVRVNGTGTELKNTLSKFIIQVVLNAN